MTVCNNSYVVIQLELYLTLEIFCISFSFSSSSSSSLDRECGKDLRKKRRKRDTSMSSYRTGWTNIPIGVDEGRAKVGGGNVAECAVCILLCFKVSSDEEKRLTLSPTGY